MYAVCDVSSQNQLSPVSKGKYREYLGKLDLQYAKLLVRDPSAQTRSIKAIRMANSFY